MSTIVLTVEQQDRIRALHAQNRATRTTVERDEDHDGHVFVSLYAPDGRFVAEHIIDADGTCCDGRCMP